MLKFIGVDLETAESTCWACGADGPEKAHIEADARGGKNVPGNFFLLCWECHKNQPDCAERSVQIAWLTSQPSYMKRIIDRVMSLSSAMMTICDNDEEAVNEWWRTLGEEPKARLLEIMTSGGDRAQAGTSLFTRLSNAMWAIVENFKTWYDESQRDEPAGNPS